MTVREGVSLAAVQLGRAASVKAASRRLGCGVRTVSAWRSGEQIPSPRFQSAIFDAFGIPIDGWRISARGGGIVEAVAGTPAAAPSSPVDPPAALDEQGSIPRLKRQVERLQAARAEPNLLPRIRLDYELAELKAETALARLVGITEQQILASAPWAALQERIAGALFDADFYGLTLVIDLFRFDEQEPRASELDRLRRDFPALVGACEQANQALGLALRARNTQKAAA